MANKCRWKGFSYSFAVSILIWLPPLLNPISASAEPTLFFPPIPQSSLEAVLKDPQWHALLHLSPYPLSARPRSLIDSKTFFLAKNGKYDSAQELAASISLLLNAKGSASDELRCRFPARTQFLTRRLYGQDADFSRCRKFRTWLAPIKDSLVTLVFAGNYLHNPASLFGHTFLKLDSRTSSASPLLATSISFAADTKEPPGLGYAFKGLFGGYLGKFFVRPYHQHIKQYNDIEQRELWEIPLALDHDEVRMLLYHLWELQQESFDYYFIDENCSFHLLALLAVAKPSAGLLDRFHYFAVPMDTVLAAVDAIGLRNAPTVQRSLSAELKAHSKTLSWEEKQIARDLVSNPELPRGGYESLGEEKKGLILRSALDLLLIKKSSLKPKAFEQKEQHLLSEALRLPISHSPPLRSPPSDRGNPLGAHWSSRLSAAYRYDAEGAQLTTELRPLYHSFDDGRNGYPDGLSMELLNTTIGVRLQDEELQLDRFVLFKFKSQPQFEPLLQAPSWSLALSADRKNFSTTQNDTVYEGLASGGVTLGTRSTLSVLFDSGVNIDDALDDGYGLFLGASLTASTAIADTLSLDANASLSRYFLGESATTTHRLETLISRRFGASWGTGLRLANIQEFGGGFGELEFFVRRYF